VHEAVGTAERFDQVEYDTGVDGEELRPGQLQIERAGKGRWGVPGTPEGVRDRIDLSEDVRLVRGRIGSDRIVEENDSHRRPGFSLRLAGVDRGLGRPQNAPGAAAFLDAKTRFGPGSGEWLDS
jgi:hypothetical protein